jgi:hypothetical protein
MIRKAVVPIMNDTRSDNLLDLFREIFGVDFPDTRLQENLGAYRDILREIKKLRDLDLGTAHPVVICDPATAWREDKHDE